jgi:RNA polymerase sigma-70 factor (ECF subfamily)
MSAPTRSLESSPQSDEDLVARCLSKDEAAVRELTRRHNRRLFRLARGVVRDDSEAEDVVQEAYVRAFLGLDRFRGDASFGTWIGRIVINEALGRVRRRRPTVEFDAEPEDQLQARILAFPHASHLPDPEHSMAQREMVTALERAIDALPEPFRVVFIARLVEGLSIEETAALFQLRPETVKTRVHRARRRVRADLEKQLGPLISAAFRFDGARCERLTARVLRAVTRTP